MPRDPGCADNTDLSPAPGKPDQRGRSDQAGPTGRHPKEAGAIAGGQMSATIANPAVYPSARSHIGVKQSYLVEVVHPALAAVSSAQTPVSKTFTIAGNRIRFLFYVPRLA